MRGQALIEYYAIFPGVITLSLVALVAIGMVVSHGLRQTVDSFSGVCETQVEPDESAEGNTVALFEGADHSVRLTDKSYDGEYTSITYTVTSSGNPSISHWMLGLPPEIMANLVSISEDGEVLDLDSDAIDFGTDPTTGVAGLKFDNGFEYAMEPYTMLTGIADEEQEGLAREVTILLTGGYTFTEEAVAVKAGQDSYVTVISMPTTQIVSGDSADGEVVPGCE
jgi:hypothetical protein